MALLRPGTVIVMLRGALVGVMCGVIWGVTARVWMRLITTDVPDFTWSGTLGIVITAAVAGLGLGILHGAQKSGRSRWWRLCAVLALPIAIAPQGIVAFLPALVLGGVALSGRLPGWLRLGCAVVTLAMPLVFVFFVLNPFERLGLPLITMFMGLWVLQAGLALGGSVVFRRWSGRVDRAQEKLGVRVPAH